MPIKRHRKIHRPSGNRSYREEREVLGKMLFPYENVVFEGGGVHGLAYIANMLYMDEIGVYTSVKRWAGSSVGTLMATCGACHLSPQLLMSDTRTLTKDILTGGVCFARALVNFAVKWGLYDIRASFYPWLVNLLQRHLHDSVEDVSRMTFGDVQRIFGTDLHLTTLNIETMQNCVFSSCATPNVYVLDVVAAGMSVEVMFQPQKIRNVQGRHIDAGCTDNMPLYVFDDDQHGGQNYYNAKTLGIRSIKDNSVFFAQPIAHTVPSPRSLKDYLENLVSLVVEAAQQRHTHLRDAERTYFMVLPRSINSLDFNISDEDRDRMQQIGYEGMKQYLQEKCEEKEF